MFGKVLRKEDAEFHMRLSFLGTKVTNYMLFLQLSKEIRGLIKKQLLKDLNGIFQTISLLKFKNAQLHFLTVTLLMHFALIQLGIKLRRTSFMMRTFTDGVQLHHLLLLKVLLLMKLFMIGYGRILPKNQETLNKTGKILNGSIKIAMCFQQFQTI